MGRKRNLSIEGRWATQTPPHYKKDDPNLNWFYQPHTITALILSGAVLVYVALGSERTQANNTIFGLGAVSLVFVVFSMVQMRDGIYRRPHPVVWRVVTGVSVLYLCLLVFLLFQSADTARLLLTYLDPNLGVQLPERSYAADCRIHTPENPDSQFFNLSGAFFDEFILAHFFGWWLKAMIFRDVYLCWVLSILFELMEISFRHWLPNFYECWWDHILLDILLCNGAGIYLGMKTCRWLEVKEYSWAATPLVPNQNKKVGKKVLSALKKGVQHISEYEEFHWDVLSSGKRFFSVCLFIMVVELVELNAFFLKFVLWVPPPHWLNISRLVLWFFIALPATRETYQFATDSTCKRMGTQAWLAFAVVGLETLVTIKYGKGMFPAPWPSYVVISWSVALGLLGLWCIWSFGIRRKPQFSSTISRQNSSPLKIGQSNSKTNIAKNK